MTPAPTNTAQPLLSRAVALHQAGNFNDAGALYQTILTSDPRNADALRLLGTLHAQVGNLEEAARLLGLSLAINPAQPDALNNRGLALQAMQRYGEALAGFEQAIKLLPDYAEAHFNRGNALQGLVRYDEAVASYDKAMELSPDVVEIYYNRSHALQELKRYDEALAGYDKAIALRPDYADAYNNRGNALQSLKRYDEALADYNRVIALKPDYAEAYTNIGNSLKDMGLLDEALAAYRSGIALDPQAITCHSSLVYSLHFHPDYTAQKLGEEHAQWHKRHAAPLEATIRPHSNDANPSRRLRIGYVSPNFALHPVAFFLLPLLQAHDRRQVEIFCYSSVTSPDAMTERLRAQADTWRDVSSLSDEALAERIREDKIDILVDLVAHMEKNRLMTFARKPAPVQVTYLAYCSTTGLRSIDYRLTDPYLDPLAPQARFYSEESVWLPETYWCYRPWGNPPEANPLPALAKGYITFGCLNNPCKITEPTLLAWRALLQIVTGAHLLLHVHPGSARKRMLEFFAAGDIDPTRIEFIGFTPLADYFALHHRIDIGLDPVPYGGGTTTCDALWMGVPIVTRTADTAVSRAGLSILSNIGMNELVVSTTEAYIETAAHLTRDLSRLSTLRAGLRARMQQSPLTDAPRFAANVEAAFRTMWQRWCDGQNTTDII